MEDNTSISNFFLEKIGESIPFLTSDNASKVILNTLLVMLCIFWIYCGIKIYLDAVKRYEANKPLQLIFLILGVLTGPIGLLIYQFMKPPYTPDELEFIRIEHKFYYQQAATVLDCISCGSYVLQNQAYCTNCGTKNRFECNVCNALTDYDDKYCHNCGNDFEDRYKNIAKDYGFLENEQSVKPHKVTDKKTVKDAVSKFLDFSANLKETVSSKTRSEEVAHNEAKDNISNIEAASITTEEQKFHPKKNKSNKKRSKKKK